MAAGRRGASCPPAHAGEAGASPRRWTTGTRTAPTRRSPAWPARRARPRCSSCSGRYGARDFRDIGHKAIYVANAWRTLQTIGWQHAEPVLRSLAYALLDHERRPTRRSATTPPTAPAATTCARVDEVRARLAATASATPTATPATCWRRCARRRRTTRRSRSSRCSTKGVAPGVGLGRAVPDGRRAADAAAGHRRPAHADDAERPALRLPDDRRRRDAARCCCCRRRRSCRCSARRCRPRQGRRRQARHAGEGRPDEGRASAEIFADVSPRPDAGGAQDAGAAGRATRRRPSR